MRDSASWTLSSAAISSFSSRARGEIGEFRLGFVPGVGTGARAPAGLIVAGEGEISRNEDRGDEHEAGRRCQGQGHEGRGRTHDVALNWRDATIRNTQDKDQCLGLCLGMVKRC